MGISARRNVICAAIVVLFFCAAAILVHAAHLTLTNTSINHIGTGPSIPRPSPTPRPRPTPWPRALPPIIVTNTNDSGPGSLRQALLTANNTPGIDTITVTFAGAFAGGTIALTMPFAPITRDGITIIGLTSNNQPNITIDASQTSNPGPILFISASSFSMSGLRFLSIPVNFNGMQIGGYSNPFTSPPQISDVNISGNVFSNGTGENTFAIYVPVNQSNETISNVTIANNTFDHLFEAINLQAGAEGASNSVIEDVVISGNVFSQMTVPPTSAVEVDATNGTNNLVQRVHIVENTFTDNFQGVILDINGATSGSSIQNTEIARNVFSGSLQALGVVAGVESGTTNNTITNTQIVDNLIELTDYNGQGAATIQIIDNQAGTNNHVTGVSFVNNTINNGNAADPPGWGVWVTSSGGVTGLSIFNTIFWGVPNANVPLNGVTSDQVSYSIVNQSGFTGNHNINADPLFVNPATNDFHLQSGSPAFHAGTSNGAPAIDLDCQPRGSPPSIGAYEFDGPNICNLARPPLPRPTPPPRPSAQR